jgi:UDP-N-acetylmuramoylalanine--D-glutamate ligase
MNFRDKKILVCGMARSGQAAALILRDLGAEVTVTDLKTQIEFEKNFAGINLRLGEDPLNFFEEFELIIISPGISVYAEFVKKAQALRISVWGEAELAYRLCPCPMIAITGTNGKTTVTTLVGEIMKRHNAGTVIAGNIGVPLTSLVEKLSPENIVVAEISSFQLETISAFKPKISAILNITEDHLDRHITMENYIAAKSRIFENSSKNEICVLNYDNCITKLLKPPCKAVFFSVKEQRIFCENENFIFKIPKTKVLAENAYAATAISLAAGVKNEIIEDVLRSFNGVPHRLEFVSAISNVDFYNDSKATNVDAAIKALENFSRPIILIGGGYDKKTDFAPWVKKFRGKS